MCAKTGGFTQKRQGFLAGSVILMVSAALTKVLGAAFKLPLTQVLGGMGMGYFSAAYSLFLPIYSLTATGLTTAIAKLTAEYLAKGDVKAVASLKKTALFAFGIFGAAASLILLLLAGPFSTYVARVPMAAPAVVLMAPSVLLGSVLSIYRGLYEGSGNMIPTAVSQVAEGLIKVVSGLALSFYCMNLVDTSFFNSYLKPLLSFIGLGNASSSQLKLAMGAAGAIGGVTLSIAGGLICVMVRSKKQMGLKGVRAVRDSGVALKLFALMAPVAVGALAANLTTLVDTFTIPRGLEVALRQEPALYGYISSSGELPGFIYGSFTGLALTIFNLVPSFTNMFGKGALPMVAGAWANRSKSGSGHLNRSVESVLLASCITACPAALGVSFLSGDILNLLFFGQLEEIAVSALPLSVLGLGIVPLSLTIPIFSMLIAIGKPYLPVKALMVGVGVKLAGNLILVSMPEVNILGAAISTCICYLLAAIIATMDLVKAAELKISWKNVLLKPLYASLLCGLCAALTRDIFSGWLSKFMVEKAAEPLGTLMAIGAGGVVYIVTLVLLKPGIKKYNR